MAVPASPVIVFVAGDNEVVQVTICSDAAGTVPVNITGRTYTMSIGLGSGTTATTSASGVVTGASGIVTFTFPTAKSSLLSALPYIYDVVETVSGLESTIMLGSLVVRIGVTA